VEVFDNSVILFVSLWLSPDPEIQVGNYSDEGLEDVVGNDLTPQKVDAYDFVANGMCG